MTRALRPICPAPSFPKARTARGFIPATVSLMLGLAGWASSARAVVSAAPETILLSTSSWSLNFGSILSYDSSTGTFTTPSTGTVPSGWNWTHLNVVNQTTNPADVTTQSLKGLTQTESDGTVVNIYATGNTDPFLSYGFGVYNPTNSPQTYTFTAGATLAPSLSGNVNIFADIGGSITNAVSGSPAQVLPIGPTIQALLLSSDGGTTFTDAGTGVGPSFTTSTSTGTSLYGIFSSSFSGPLSSPVNYWQLKDQFTLTGNGDAASFTGFAEISPNGSIVIPEPSTYAALLGALSFGLVALRRSRKLAA